MPTVQYVNLIRGVDITATMPTPKRITELAQWLKHAQLAIKEIPRPIAEAQSMALSAWSDGWYVLNTDITEKWIKFNIENKFSEKAHIVIDRTARKGIGF
jgi:hypothetical protein